MGLFDGSLAYRPIRFPSIPLPQAAVGLEMPGNRTTSPGRQFFSAITNLLQESFKLTSSDDDTDFGTDMKGAGAVMGFIFPGLDYEPTAQEFQHIQYLGSKKRRLSVWSEAGTSTSSDALSLDSYLTTWAFGDPANPANSAKAVDYSGFWQSNQGRLSSSSSLWQTILNRGYSGLSSVQDQMMLLLGLTELKRRWIYGMRQIGVNPFMAASTFDGSRLSGVGGVNVQILYEYIWQREMTVGRMKEVFGAPETTGPGRDFYLWAQNIVKPELLSYLSGIDKTARNAAFDAYRAARGVTTIEALQAEHQWIDRAAGMIPYPLTEAEARLERLKSELALIDPAATEAISAKLTDIDAAIAEVNRLQDDVNGLVGNFWNEFSMERPHDGFSQPVGADPADADMEGARLAEIRTNFEGRMKEAMSYTISVMSNNMLFREMNRQSDAKVKQEKEDNYQSKVREGKAAAERMAESKKMQKTGEARAAQKAPAAKPKEKPKEKPKVPEAQRASPVRSIGARKVK